MPAGDQRAPVDPIVFLHAQVVVDPVLGDLAPVFERVGVGRVVVRPHDRPLQVLAEFGFHVGVVEPVLEVAVSLAPVPIDHEEGDPVLDGPLDLPVGALGVRFVVPAKDRLAQGVVEDRLPARHRVPAGEVERADVVGAFDRLRLGDVGGGGHLRGGRELDGRRGASRVDARRFQLHAHVHLARPRGFDLPRDPLGKVVRELVDRLLRRAEDADAVGRRKRGHNAFGHVSAQVADRKRHARGPTGPVHRVGRAEVGDLQLRGAARGVGDLDRVDRRPGAVGVGGLHAEEDDLVAPVPEVADVDVVGVHLAVRPERE